MISYKGIVEDSKDTYFGYTLSLINGKWKLLILYNLGKYKVLRYNEIQRVLEKITYRTLSSTLKELEGDGLIHREEYPQIPPKVEYSLTQKGESLLPILASMCEWGEKYKKPQD